MRMVTKKTTPPPAPIQGPRININVPEETRRAWKIAAVERDLTMTQMLVQAMEAYLAKKQKK